MNPARVHDMLENYGRLELFLHEYAAMKLMDESKDDYLEDYSIRRDFVEFLVRHRDGSDTVQFAEFEELVDWAEARQGGI